MSYEKSMQKMAADLRAVRGGHWMDKPAEPKLTQGDLLILIGLVTAEWSEVGGDTVRTPYFNTLRNLRQALIAADRSPKP